jgi:hypothetical protein
MADAERNPGRQPLSGAGNPGTLSAASSQMQERITILRDCYGGTETMRLNQALLPQYEKETATRYQSRLASTFALNKLREAVDAASAKPFRSLIKVTNTDPELDLWINDIDLQGNHLHVFGHRFFNEAVLTGMAHILVDHPDTSQMANLAVQKAANARPFMKLIRADQLVAAYDEYVGGDRLVTHARIRTVRLERTPDFKEVIFDQIWVIEVEPGSTNGVVQLWESPRGQGAGGDLTGASGGSGAWEIVGESKLTMPQVPLVTMYAGEKEADYVVRPPFMDLAYKQIEHWISSSDQRSILAAGRFPILACSGVQLDDDNAEGFSIGPYKILYSPEPAGRWYFVEPKGTAISSGQKDLEMLEMHMDILALNPVVATHRQYVPQNERDIQEARVHSVIHDLALSCKDGLEQAIVLAGQWVGRDYSQVSVGINVDFDNAKEVSKEIDVLTKAYQAGALSRAAYLQELKNRNTLGMDFDIMAELAQAPGVLPNPGEGGPKEPPPSIPPTQPSKPVSRAQGDPTGGGAVDFPDGRERPTRQI